MRLSDAVRSIPGLKLTANLDMPDPAICPYCSTRLPSAAQFCPRCGVSPAAWNGGTAHQEPTIPLPYADAPPPKAQAVWHEPNGVRFLGLLVAVVGGGLITTGDLALAVLGALLFAGGMIAVIVTLFA